MSNTLLPLQGEPYKNTRKPRALPWAKCLLAVVIAALCFSSCAGPMMKNITKQLPPLNDTVEVVVYDSDVTAPEHSEVLGGIVISGMGLDKALIAAKKAARSVGGNGIEIQYHNSIVSDSLHHHTIAAFILNINDSVAPTAPATFDKMKFDDYIVTKDGDTLHGSIVEESKKQLTIVHGYDRQGYRKAILTQKRDLLSYHIEDSKALDEANFNKNKQQKELFTASFAIDGGYSVDGSYALAANVRFSRKNKIQVSGFTSHTFGLHYDYSYNYYRTHFIAGSIGFMGVGSKVKPEQQVEFYLDGACDYPKSSKSVSTVIDFLFGYINYRDRRNVYDGDFWNVDYTRNNAIGFGFDYGHDIMLNEHFALGWMYYGYLGIPLDKGARWCGAFNITAGLRYYL